LKRLLIAAPLILGCGDREPPPQLLLDGPGRVRVEALGPVMPPPLHLSDGSVPEGVQWQVSSDTILRVEGSGFVAVGTGEATVTGHWGGQVVRWTAVVRPDLVLRFQDPPASLRVGEAVSPAVSTTLDGAPAEQPPQLKWSSSDPAVAVVDEGVVTAVAPGVVWITASLGESQAMLELAVEP